MLVEFSVIPIGGGRSLSGRVAKIIDIVDKSGLKYKLTDMGTIVEGSWDRVFSVIKKCHRQVLKDSGRAYTRVVVDETRGRNRRISEKISAVEKKLGRAVKV
ncbi:MAG: MTH1187 family thiamine-binding protein [Candidatus Omnitrophica bacterium]|nr:MTH1187 family thiamine-binding protein [Candidatus Omnitrophota bacterium]